MTPSLIREAIVRRAAWSKTWSYVLRVALSFCLVLRASTWDSRCRIRRSAIIAAKRTVPSTKSFVGSEDVNRFWDEAATRHVAGLGLRVAVLDVALLVLELPDLHDEEVPLADPHPFLELPRDPTEPAVPVRAHHADPGRPRSWSAIPRISPSFVRGIRTRTTSSSATPASMGRDGLNICGVHHSGRSTASATRDRSSGRVSATGAYGNGTGGASKNVGLQMAR